MSILDGQFWHPPILPNVCPTHQIPKVEGDCYTRGSLVSIHTKNLSRRLFEADSGLEWRLKNMQKITFRRDTFLIFCWPVFSHNLLGTHFILSQFNTVKQTMLTCCKDTSLARQQNTSYMPSSNFVQMCPVIEPKFLTCRLPLHPTSKLTSC